MSEEKHKNSSPDRNTAYILIGIGVVFLLINVLNISIARLWPLLLVALGVYLLLNRSNTIGSTAQTGTFQAPLDDASAADVELRLSVGRSQVDSQAQPGNLIDAELTYVGEVDFEVSGAEHKQVRLGQTADAALHWINPANWFAAGHGYNWRISLNPSLPLNLDIRGGAGEMQLDLDQLKLTGLRVHGGAGEMQISLPVSETSYPVRVVVDSFTHALLTTWSPSQLPSRRKSNPKRAKSRTVASTQQSVYVCPAGSVHHWALSIPIGANNFCCAYSVAVMPVTDTITPDSSSVSPLE
jgi:hypothetical protein